MAKHRAPSQVEIASTFERTMLHEFVDRYWKVGAGIAVLGAAIAILVEVQSRSGQESVDASWNRLGEELNYNFLFGAGPVSIPSGSVLKLLSDELGEGSAGAWASALVVGREVEDEEWSQAEGTLREFQSSHPDHILCSQPLYPAPEEGSLETLSRHIEDRASRMKSWEASHPLLFANPELPADAPRVRITTDKGSIVVGLYTDRAPKHAEAFLAHVESGEYTGSKFHFVTAETLIQGGDPNSVDGEKETWGRGGMEDPLDPEVDPQLRHFEGVLAAPQVTSVRGKSSSWQFYLTAKADHAKDGANTVFGRVLEGIEVVRLISNESATEGSPENPVAIEGTEVLAR